MAIDKKFSIPAGIEIRHGKRIDSLRIRFHYKNKECCEGLKLKPTKNNILRANKLRAEIINAIARGTFNYTEYFPESSNVKHFGHIVKDITVGQLLEDFLRQTEKSLQKSTFISYKRLSNKYLFPNFSDILITDLTPCMIREWISKTKLTVSSIRKILYPLRAAVDQAINDDIIICNPFDRVKINRLINKDTAKSKYEVNPFNIEEIKAILKASDGQIRNLLQFAFFSGLRTSELLALSWDNINWHKKTATINKAFVYGELKTTKTPTGNRKLLLLPPAFEALKLQKKHTFSQKGRVFYNPKTNEPWLNGDQIYNTAWSPTIKSAKVKYRNPYQTRHTFASMMLSSGENILWVAQQMGHVNIDTLIKHYSRWIPDSNVLAGYVPVNNWSVFL